MQALTCIRSGLRLVPCIVIFQLASNYVSCNYCSSFNNSGRRMSLARFQYLLLLITAIVAGSTAYTLCNKTQLAIIDSMATTGFVEINLGICNIVSSYKVYPFRSPPTGELQKRVCGKLFCQLGIKQFITNKKFPICDMKMNGKSITVQRHLQSICPDLNLRSKTH
ncbi:hypothetical protein AM587_10001603 [Phytophthora nicotianae]|uniref:Uncharacterized protein n=1 Tax=Phytophthora nicotianae TaxID=4792 RepID=A0A0W8C423_PHYNI|nr:hypothetical protein AM587_10000528 [Phytophthora nicotianae]KUF89649.1 hypothetical protein AM587_10001603 [Phytophthora nicotianae]